MACFGQPAALCAVHNDSARGPWRVYVCVCVAPLWCVPNVDVDDGVTPLARKAVMSLSLVYIGVRRVAQCGSGSQRNGAVQAAMRLQMVEALIQEHLIQQQGFVQARIEETISILPKRRVSISEPGMRIPRPIKKSPSYFFSLLIRLSDRCNVALNLTAPVCTC